MKQSRQVTREKRRVYKKDKDKRKKMKKGGKEIKLIEGKLKFGRITVEERRGSTGSIYGEIVLQL
jgi:hypothetical protein